MTVDITTNLGYARAHGIPEPLLKACDEWITMTNGNVSLQQSTYYSVATIYLSLSGMVGARPPGGHIHIFPLESQNSQKYTLSYDGNQLIVTFKDKKTSIKGNIYLNTYDNTETLSQFYQQLINNSNKLRGGKKGKKKSLKKKKSSKKKKSLKKKNF